MKVFVLQMIEVINKDDIATEVKLFASQKTAEKELELKYLRILDWIYDNEDDDNWYCHTSDIDYYVEDNDHQNKFIGYIEESEIL